jgi:DNA-binding NtrC family response regulator
VGAYDYLTKPFSLGQLDVMLKRIADRASLEQENRELVRNPAAAPLMSAAKTEAKTINSARVESVLMRIEQVLMRLEAKLELVSGVPSARR